MFPASSLCYSSLQPKLSHSECDDKTWSVLLIAATGMHEMYQFSDSFGLLLLLNDDELIFVFLTPLV